MKCRHFKKSIPLSIDNETTGFSASEFEEHKISCSNCNAAFLRYQQYASALDRGLQSIAEDGPCPDVLEASVIRILKDQIPGHNRLNGVLDWFRSASSASSFAAMACVIAAALILLFHGMVDSTSTAAKVTSGKTTAFTVKPEQNGRVDAGYSARRYARIETRKAGWRR